MYLCTFLFIFNSYDHGKTQQTTLNISAEQLILNISGLAIVFIRQTPHSSSAADESQAQSSSVSPESNSGSSSSAPNNNSEIPDSIIFTKKAKKEAKQTAIIEALKKSIDGRRDKTRAFVDELHSWQKDGYVDAHYNAKVMYDELAKLLPIAFGYDVFKRHYNNTRI